jgi:germination protein M
MIRTVRRLRPVTLVAALAVLVAACSSASGPLGTPATPPPTNEPSVEVPSSDATPGPSAPASATPSSAPSSTASPASSDTMVVRAYFFLGSFTGSGGLAPVLREVPKTAAVATAAMRELLSGPNDKELGARPAMYTVVPDGTRLLGLAIDNRVATVNLSREFESGGGSASMLGRLAQVVFTLTQFSTVDGVRFQLDGVPVTVFGGEGVILDHAVGRADYPDQIPAIFLDRPAWNAALGNPGTVSGLANVFEATFRVRLLDAAGGILSDQQVMASSGTGTWGTFTAQASYDVAHAQWGTLRVFAQSARDGTAVDVTEYPVWLTPAG